MRKKERDLQRTPIYRGNCLRSRVSDIQRREEDLVTTSFDEMAGHQGFVAGTECVGKFNFLGSAAHVSYFITYVPPQICTCTWSCRVVWSLYIYLLSTCTCVYSLYYTCMLVSIIGCALIRNMFLH